MSDRLVVDLGFGCGLWPDPWPLLLVPWSSGVIFKAWTGGLVAQWRELESIYLPVFGSFDYTFPRRLEALNPGCYGEPISAEEANKLDGLFRELHLPLVVSRQRLAESYEAWVWVEIMQPNNDLVLANFAGYEAVLIWCNFDEVDRSRWREPLSATEKAQGLPKNRSIYVWPHPWPQLLMPWPTDFGFEMQCGGLNCDYRQVDGIYLPIIGQDGTQLNRRLSELHPGCVSYNQELERVELRLSMQEADAIDALFAECRVPLKVVRSRLAESCEAWAHVQIIAPNQDRVLEQFAGHEGVLIWYNCD